MVAKAAVSPVISSVRAIGGSSGAPSGSPESDGEARHRLGQGGEPGPAGVRAGLAEAGDPGDDQVGVASVAARRARGRGARACPGRKFSTSTSADGAQREHVRPGPRRT